MGYRRTWRFWCCGWDWEAVCCLADPMAIGRAARRRAELWCLLIIFVIMFGGSSFLCGGFLVCQRILLVMVLPSISLVQSLVQNEGINNGLSHYCRGMQNILHVVYFHSNSIIVTINNFFDIYLLCSIALQNYSKAQIYHRKEIESSCPLLPSIFLRGPIALLFLWRAREMPTGEQHGTYFKNYTPYTNLIISN